MPNQNTPKSQKKEPMSMAPDSKQSTPKSQKQGTTAKNGRKGNVNNPEGHNQYTK